MALSSPRLRRLDEALAALAPDSDAMLLSELDGFLAGVILSPGPIAPEEWLPIVWSGEGDAAPFTDEREAEWYAAQVLGHRDAVERALAKGGGAYAPFLEIDRRHGEVLWEMWVEGFAEALTLWPEAAPSIAGGGEAAVAAQAGMATLVEIARDQSDLPREAIERLTEEAPALIAQWIAALYDGRRHRVPAYADAPEPGALAKAGRNDPCPCGSGRKYKKCCGGA